MSKRVPHEQLSVPEITPGIYRHYKGDHYEVINTGLDTETLEPVVIYKPLYDTPVPLWVRPFALFMDKVEIEGKMVERFMKVDE
jgi:hypothetical protein